MRINKLLLTVVVAALSVSTFSLAHGRKKRNNTQSMKTNRVYTLYTIPGTCSTGIGVLMKKLDVPYKVVKRSDVPDYQAIVPTNQVPALKTHRGQVITEGGAIALYLLEKYGKNALPSKPEKRAEFYQWLNFDYATLHPAYSKIFSAAYNPNLDSDTKKELMQYLADSLSNLWKILDDRLANKRFIVGNKPSHIDYMVAIYASWNKFFPDTKITLGENVERLVEEIRQLPEFKAAYLEEGISEALDQ